MFRLSEGVFFRWNPKYFGDVMNASLDVLRQQEVQESKGEIQTSLYSQDLNNNCLFIISDNLSRTVRNLIKDIEGFNSILERTNMLK